MHDTSLHTDPENTTIALKSGDSFIFNSSRTTQGFFLIKSTNPSVQKSLELINCNGKSVPKTQNKSKCLSTLKSWFQKKH